MIVCIEITQRTKSELDRLLELGQYKDYSEAVSVAVANQLLLHKQASSTQAVLLADERATAGVRRDREQIQLPCFEVPAMFSGNGISRDDSLTGPIPNDAFVQGQEVPLDRWIFGQHNKLLPAKASCRALGHLLSADRAGIPVSKAAGEIAAGAVKLGDYLRLLESRSNFNRDDSISFAFPYTDCPNGDKSRLRYANQFVAGLTKQGLLSGLLIDLKLINQDHSKLHRLVLTDVGWRFASLPNPVLDSDGSRVPQEKFSQEEIKLLVDHIRVHVPAEAFAWRAVLGAVADGANTPEQLDEALQKYLSKRHDKPFTRAFLTTQRAGVVSRLADLSLIQRVRDRVKVKYVISEAGSEFLGKARTENLTA